MRKNFTTESSNKGGPVIPLEPSQADRLAAVLTRARRDEPHFRYVVPDEQSRLRLLPGLFLEAIRVAQQYGEIQTTDALDGCALWIAPGRGLETMRRIQSGFPSTLLQFGPANLRRCARVGLRLDEVHKRLVRRPHWYLLTLGVEPSEQEEMVVSALIEPLLNRADSDNVPCYVEAFSEKDLRFHVRRGFRIVGSGRITASGPDFWALIREPQTHHDAFAISRKNSRSHDPLAI